MTDNFWISISIVLLCVVISAFFNGAETGLTTSSRARLTEMEKRGSSRAATALKLIGLPERLIGSILLANTVALIASSAVATLAFTKAFGEGGEYIASAIMTVLLLIFAEVMPKTYAFANPDGVATAVAPIMRLIVAVLGPIVIGVEFIVRKTLGVFGVDTENIGNVLSARDELRGTIELQHKEGEIVKKDRDMLGGLLDLQDLVVSDVMIHRTKMVMIDASMDMESIVKEVQHSGKTRLPVWKDSQDNIIGILHAKGMFHALLEHDGDAKKISLNAIMTDPWFVPDTRPLEDQLNAFLRRKTHFAVVVDEYGEVQGLITLEDIIEEIVGDIKDEFDAVSNGVRKQRDGSYMIDGAVPLRDLNRALDWDLPDEEATTLAGLVIHEARMIPDTGQIFNFYGFRFEVLKKRRQQLTVIRVTRVEETKAKSADAEPGNN